MSIIHSRRAHSLLLLAAAILFMTSPPARAQEEAASPVVAPGTVSALFQVLDYGVGDMPGHYEVGIEHRTWEHAGLRLGFDYGIQSNTYKTTRKAAYDTLSSTEWYEGDETDAQVSVGLLYVLYLQDSGPIQVSLACGPRVGYNRWENTQKSHATHSEFGATPTSSYTSTSDKWSVSGDALFMIHWALADRVALVASYGVNVEYFTNSGSSRHNRDTRDVINRSNSSIDYGGWDSATSRASIGFMFQL